MENQMQQYIEKEYEVLFDLIKKGKRNMKDIADALSGSEPDRLVLVGSGSSYNACEIARPFMEKVLRREITTVYPTKEIDLDSLNGERKLLIAVSQEGTSSNTIAFVKQHKQSFMTTIAATAVHPCLLESFCDQHLLIACGNEMCGPKSLGVSATVVSLWISAVELGLVWGTLSFERYEELYKQLETVVSSIPECLLKSKDWVRKNTLTMKDARAIAVVGSDAVSGVVREAALKLDETVYIQSTPYDFEEFIHGPFCVIGTDVHLYFLTQDEDNWQRMYQLIQFAREQKTPVFHVHIGNADVPSDLRLGPDCKEYNSLLLLIPMQVICANICIARGIDIDANRYEELTNIMGSKLKTIMEEKCNEIY